MKALAILVAICWAVCLPRSSAQDLEDFVKKYSSENGRGYMQPLADAFTSTLNAGLYQNASVPLDGFHFGFGVVAMAAPIPDSRKTFTAKTEGFFNPASSTQAPTIFGSINGSSVQGVGGTEYAFPGGFNLSLFAIAAPQLTIGSLYGTEAVIRFFQVKLGDNIGTLKLWGIGARHNISQYFRKIPLDVAFGIYQQHFEIGRIVSANATLISAQGSYQTGVLVLYGGPGVEFSTMDLEYNGDSGDVSVSLKGANSIRFTLGAALSLAFFRVYADYNLASQSAFALGFGFGF